MNSRSLLKPAYLAVAPVLLASGMFAFVFNEARKEVYFLCSNFEAGTAFTSVVRQLNTLSWSDYTLEDLTEGQRIVQSSAFNFHLFHCRIEFNRVGVVVSATYQ